MVRLVVMLALASVMLNSVYCVYRNESQILLPIVAESVTGANEELDNTTVDSLDNDQNEFKINNTGHSVEQKLARNPKAAEFEIKPDASVETSGSGHNFTVKMYKCFCPPGNVKIKEKCVKVEALIDVLVDPIDEYIEEVSDLGILKTSYYFKCDDGSIPYQLRENEYTVTYNGVLTYNGLVLHSPQYCLEYIEEDKTRFWVAIACITPPTINRCCPHGQLFDYQIMGCTFSDDELTDLTDLPINITDPDVGIRLSNDAIIPECQKFQSHQTLVIGETLSEDMATLFFNIKGIELDVMDSILSFPKHYKFDEFCVAPSNNNTYMAMFCYGNPFQVQDKLCSNIRTCIRKCCPNQQVYDSITNKCKEPNNSSNIYHPTIYKEDWYDVIVLDESNISYQMISGQPFCYDPTLHTSEFHILGDGSVYIDKDRLRYSSEYYCVENKQGYPGQVVTTLYYCQDMGEEYGSSCQRLKLSLTKGLMAVSVVFLFCTLVVCKIVPELHAYISGKNLITHVFALLLSFVFSFIINVGELNNKNILFCQVMALATQYAYLATFFWLNAMCFELWYPSRFRPKRSHSASESRQKYKLYSLYGWGIPLAIVLITLIVQVSVSPQSEAAVYAPHFGHPYCWFRDDASAWLFFDGIILLLSAANLLFFFDMAKIYIKQCMESTFIHLSREIYAERVVLYLKLFLVMGVTWIFEQLSKSDDSCAGWIVIDAINLLRGPCVFFSVVSTKSVLRKLRSRTAAWCRCNKTTRVFPPTVKSHAVVSTKQKTTALPSLRVISNGRLPSLTSSQNSDSFVRTEDSSLDPKSESSVTNRGIDNMSFVNGNSEIRQISEVQTGSRAEDSKTEITRMSEMQTTCGSKLPDDGACVEQDVSSLQDSVATCSPSNETVTEEIPGESNVIEDTTAKNNKSVSENTTTNAISETNYNENSEEELDDHYETIDSGEVLERTDNGGKNNINEETVNANGIGENVSKAANTS